MRLLLILLALALSACHDNDNDRCPGWAWNETYACDACEWVRLGEKLCNPACAPESPPASCEPGQFVGCPCDGRPCLTWTNAEASQ